jgi:hypothetical protein
MNGLVYIRGISFGHLTNFFGRGGINRGERLSGGAVQPFIVDQ